MCAIPYKYQCNSLRQLLSTILARLAPSLIHLYVTVDISPWVYSRCRKLIFEQFTGFLACKLLILISCPIFPVYIVFGATGAVGQSLCKRLAAQPGSRVVVSGRSQEKLDEIASAHGAHPIAADILDSKQVGDVLLEREITSHLLPSLCLLNLQFTF